MADTILYVQTGLSDIAAGIGRITTAAEETAQALTAVDTSQRAGGNLPLPHAAGGLSGLYSQSLPDGGSVRDSIAAYTQCLRQYAAYCQKLKQTIAEVDGLFSDTERQLGTMKPADTGTVESGGTPAPARPFDSPRDALTEDWRKRFEEIRKRMEELQKQREEIRQEYIESINQRRMFDGDGWFGGDQGAPSGATSAEKRQYKSIIEDNIGKTFTDKELEKYLQRINHEGCGYVCIINAIFQMYEGRAEEFEAAFGFPMYNEAGDFNYNVLLVDIYSSTDNHFNEDGTDVVKQQDRQGFFESAIPWYNEYTDTTGFGMTNTDFEYRGEMYLREHGIDADIAIYENGSITTENVQEFMQDNTVSILVGKPFYMYEPSGDGEAVPYTNGGPTPAIEGGHFMTITGVETVTVDGEPREMYVVSSWGQTFYVDPSDAHGYQHYQVIPRT